MLLYQRIEYILQHLDFVDSHFDELSSISRRMYAMGIANELYQLESQLSVINDQIETTLSLEDAFLGVGSMSRINTDYQKLREESFYRENSNNDAEINKLVDIFPLNKENYSFSQDHAEKLKTALRYLCCDSNISSRDYAYAVQRGLRNVGSLLASISHKKSCVKDYQYEDFWYVVLNSYYVCRRKYQAADRR